MSSRRNRKPSPHLRTVLMLVGLLTLASAVRPGSAEPPQAFDVAIIVHVTNPVRELSLDKLRAIFNLRHRYWPDGKPVQVVLPGNGLPEQKVLLDKVYRMSAGDLAERWRQRIFTGEIVTAPTGAPSPGLLVHAVRDDPEAIAAVRASAIPADGDVRAIAVDGKLPGEAGYPLH